MYVVIRIYNEERLKEELWTDGYGERVSGFEHKRSCLNNYQKQNKPDRRHQILQNQQKRCLQAKARNLNSLSVPVCDQHEPIVHQKR